MHTTQRLLDELKRVYKLPSDYALAKHWGVSTQRVSKYRNGADTLGAEIAIRTARELGLDPGYVLACMQAERAKRTDERQAWERVAKRMAQAAIFLLCVGVTWWLDVDLETVAQAAVWAGGYTHYAKYAAAIAAFAVVLIFRSARPRP